MKGPNQTDLWQVEYKCTLLKKYEEAQSMAGGQAAEAAR